MTLTERDMAEIAFWKMHGLGNDFVVLNAIQQEISLHGLPIAKWANRHSGIGFDQLLIISGSSKADIACDIFNADGSIAEQCGNGVRCVARFVYEQQIVNKQAMTIETKGGVVQATLRDDGLVEVDMGTPVLQPGLVEIPLETPIQVFALSLGNPHAIVLVDSVKEAAVAELGRAISQHALFPNQANVGFMQVIDKHTIRLRTYERGVGETYACGTNACAAVVAAIEQLLCASPVTVQLTLGHLHIEYADQHVYQVGPAEKTFTGSIVLSG